MARYDSPGYPDQLPGFAPRSSHDYMTAPGTAGAVQSEGDASLGRVTVTNTYGSTQTDQPSATVAVGDTASFPDDVAVHLGGPFLAGGTQGSRPDRTGAGEGNAGHQPHPNAGK